MHTGEQQPSPAEQLETAQRAGEQEQDWGPETAEQSREPEGPVQELIQELVEDPFPGHDGQEQLDRAPFRGTGQEPVTPEGQQDQLDPLLPAGGALSAEDELRLANAYVAAYPREAAEARAAMFGEENPHFTVQRAYAQVRKVSSVVYLETRFAKRFSDSLWLRWFFDVSGMVEGDGGTTEIIEDRRKMFSMTSILDGVSEMSCEVERYSVVSERGYLHRSTKRQSRLRFSLCGCFAVQMSCHQNRQAKPK